MKRRGSAAKKPVDRAAARAKFKDLIQNLDSMSKTKPNLYFARVIALAAAGYVYIWAVLALLFVCCIGVCVLLVKVPFLAIKAGLPLLLVIGVIFRSFWLKTSEIKGIYLKRREYPEVFSLVETIRRSIKAPPVHDIVVVPDFNAAVLQKPRLGLLGWHKNYLLIGLPLTQAFTYTQLQSVLAHEMGHLAGSHGARTAWIYGVRAVWTQLIENLGKDRSFATLLFRRFFSWYSPYFDAYSFALARVQEHHADECSVDLVGKETSASALVGVAVKSAFLERKYWQNIFDEAKHSKDPPLNVYPKITDAINSQISAPDAETWLAESLRRKTDYDDTHPCLSDRISTILGKPPNEAAEWSESHLSEILPVDEPAARRLFGEKFQGLLDELDSNWRDQIQSSWEKQYGTYVYLRGELSRLEEKSDKDELSIDDFVTLASRTAQVRDFAAAEPLFEKALEREPENATLLYTYGQWLLNEQKPAGVGHLERAMELDRSIALDCCIRICSYFKAVGHEEESDRYAYLAEQRLQEYVEARVERAGVSEKDRYKDHSLPPETINEIADKLADFKAIKKAYFVQKDLKCLPEKPLYLLVLEFGFRPFRSGKAQDQGVIAEVAQQVKFPGETLILTRLDAPKSLKQSLTTVATALILDR